MNPLKANILLATFVGISLLSTTLCVVWGISSAHANLTTTPHRRSTKQPSLSKWAEEGKTLGYSAELARAQTWARIKQLRSYHPRYRKETSALRSRVRGLYRLARGGVAQLLFSDKPTPSNVTSHPALQRSRSTTNQVLLARDLAQAVSRDLQGFSSYQLSERKIAREILASTREYSFYQSLDLFRWIEGHALAVASNSRGHGSKRNQTPWNKLSKRVRISTRKSKYSLDLRWPVRNHDVVGKFGNYSDPETKAKLSRHGIELRTIRREPIRTMKSGIVTRITQIPTYDDVVIIDHGNSYSSLTGRLIEVQVEEGQHVDAGTILGRSAPKSRIHDLGRTVYIELRHGERPINPLTHLPKKTNP